MHMYICDVIVYYYRRKTVNEHPHAEALCLEWNIIPLHKQQLFNCHFTDYHSAILCLLLIPRPSLTNPFCVLCANIKVYQHMG